MSATVELPKGVKVLQNVPLDSKYYNDDNTPYLDEAQVLSELPVDTRSIGLVVNIAGEEWWFEDGVNLTPYGGIKEIVAGNNITIDNTNPKKPKVTATDTVFPEAPNDNKIYGRKDSSWVEVTSEEFPEAPQDGKFYARRDSDWSEVVHPPFPEAPQDNEEYARKNAEWVVVTDTAYDKGTLQHLIDGTSEVFMVWSSAVLKQWIDERLKPILIKKSSTFALNSSHNNNIIGLEDATCNIDPTQLEENGFSASFKNVMDAGGETSLLNCSVSVGYDYKLNTEPRVSSNLIKVHPGQTCTVTKFPGDNTIYIDGDVE